MQDISLIKLLESGCHFGHRVERWHPKAASIIYQEREGIHIIDLVKTKAALLKAAEFVKGLGSEGKSILIVATKRQARGVVSEAAKRAQIPYLTTRWVGGLLTNWEEVKKNIDKLNRLNIEKQDDSWQKFPKHEIVKLLKHLRKLEIVYGGISKLDRLPDALFIVDVKKEMSCLRESLRKEITTVAIVDTNADPTNIDYPIPGNDDAVASIQLITNYMVDAYLEGKRMGEKKESSKETKTQISKEEKKEITKEGKTQSLKEKGEKKEEMPKKRGRPKKDIKN